MSPFDTVIKLPSFESMSSWIHGAICRQTSDSRTCHTTISDSRKNVFLWATVGPKHSVNPPLNCTLEILLFTHLLT